MKKVIITVVLAFALVTTTSTAFASNSTSRVQTPAVKACIASELLKRDNAFNAARIALDAAVKSASDTRKSALEAIPAGITRAG